MFTISIRARRALTAVVVATATLSVAAPAPASAAARRPLRPNHHYVVVLHDDANADAVALAHASRFGVRVRHVYRRALNGYAATMSTRAARAIRLDPAVEMLETDHRVRITSSTKVPWGLDRLDQSSLPLDGSFLPPGDGRGVTAYVIDTGIRTTHHEFGGRARIGFDAVRDGNTGDCNGHGTHVAGTIGGAHDGVARQVTLVAVRVLECGGGGTISSVIAGVDWVTADHQPDQPAIANMSLGGRTSAALDRAVSRSIADGVAYAVAAGNAGADACGSSPARVPAAMTVAASDRDDNAPSWSNTGSCVDWYAPGVSIKSAWKTSDTSSKTISGTSMASPHTAGVAAVYLSRHPSATPRQVADALRAASVPGAIAAPPATTRSLVHVTP